MSVIVRSAIVFLGAGIGGTSRYWIGLWIANGTTIPFPFNTLAINVTGSLLIGFLMGLPTPLFGHDNWRLLLVVGLLGGYTTFSAFSNELLNLLRDKHYAYALAYAGGSLLLGLAAAAAGLFVAVAIHKS